MATRHQIMKFLFYLPFLFFSFSCYPTKIQAASEIQFNTLDISRPQESTCNRASKAGSSTLEVFNKYGPCAHGGEDSKQAALTSLAEILVKDQVRVQSIEARGNKQTRLPARSGNSLGSGDYVVTIGLGTPEQSLILIFDTGSDVTWTQCQPCAQHCYPQNNHIFDPSASTTYSNVSCNSKECKAIYEGRPLRCYENSTCAYGVGYGDGSYTKGFYSRDKLTLTPTVDVFPDFLFGCGQNNTGLFGKVAGILGLGRAPKSFVSQTANKYAKTFSYCLPPNIRSTGFLRFGEYNNKNNKAMMVFTPLVPAPRDINYPSTLYYIEITAISVGGTRLPINESVFKTKEGTIVDSGTVITRLPPAAYTVLSEEFKKQMTKVFKYKVAPPYSILDTCFHITMMNNTNISLPTMSFTFKGNATVDLDPNGILVEVSSKVVCLAFAGNNYTTDLAIFGNIQQVNLEVVYDVAGEKLGFRPNPNCQ